MDVHRLRHLGLKPFVCDARGCDKAFTVVSPHNPDRRTLLTASYYQKNNLKKHLLSAHSRVLGEGGSSACNPTRPLVNPRESRTFLASLAGLLVIPHRLTPNVPSSLPRFSAGSSSQVTSVPRLPPAVHTLWDSTGTLNPLSTHKSWSERSRSSKRKKE